MTVIALPERLIKIISSFPLTSLLWYQSIPGSTSGSYMRSFLCFCSQQFLKSLWVLTHQEYVSNYPLKICHGVIEPASFTCKCIQVLFSVTRSHSQVTYIYDHLLNLWVTKRGLKYRFKIWVTLNDVCFPIPSPEIWILPKPWFSIMEMDPPYP